MKVFFLTNIPSPYRVDFFNELGRHCDLTVVFETQKAAHRNKNWLSDNYDNFSVDFLNNDGNNKKIKMIRKLFSFLKKDFNHIIIGGYSTFYGSLAIEFCKLHDIPFIINADGGFIEENENNLKLKLKKHLIGSASYWLSTGEVTNKYLLHYGADFERIYNYPFTSIRNNDIEYVSSDEKNKLKTELGFDLKPNLLFVGHLIHGKGIEILLKSFKGIDSQFNLILVGEGESKQEFINLKQKLDLKNVYFEGFKSTEEVQNYYKISDLFIFPTRSDVWGLVINEAMSKGLPVITTDKCIAGLELVQEGLNGYIVPVDDYNKINYYVKEIFENTDNLEFMQKNSLNSIKKYTIENMANRTYTILKSLI